MKDMVLFPEDIDRMNNVLSLLVTKANLLLAVLVNKDGRLLTSQGMSDQVDTISIAALVAGNSASTLAIANLLGETEFSAMYHQGKNKHIYIAIVDDNTFLTLVFDDRTNIDRVKVFVRQFERQLKDCLVQVYSKTEDDFNLDFDMVQYDGSNYQSNTGVQESGVHYSSHTDSIVPPNNNPQMQEMDNRVPENSDIFYIESDQNGGGIHPPTDTGYIYLNNLRDNKKRKNID
ncbi:MAG: roadblock/LC7 domain-containing protein [Fibrobacter sp.]|nr:roadblock/LC7 domain-containing protein [Fibrobacter sp.]